MKEDGLLTCSLRVESGVVAAEGSSFPFKREDKVGASDAAGASPLKLDFAFFEGALENFVTTNKQILTTRGIGINFERNKKVLTSRKANHLHRQSRRMASSAVGH
jgi:hypothetical protein